MPLVSDQSHFTTVKPKCDTGLSFSSQRLSHPIKLMGPQITFCNLRQKQTGVEPSGSSPHWKEKGLYCLGEIRPRGEKSRHWEIFSTRPKGLSHVIHPSVWPGDTLAFSSASGLFPLWYDKEIGAGEMVGWESTCLESRRTRVWFLEPRLRKK